MLLFSIYNTPFPISNEFDQVTNLGIVNATLKNTLDSQNVIGMTMHEVNQHVAKETIGPGKPRTSVAVHAVLEIALMHISIGCTLLQPINALENLLLVLPITTPSQCNVRCIRSDNQ